jgi:hypothetical protein
MGVDVEVIQERVFGVGDSMLILFELANDPAELTGSNSSWCLDNVDRFCVPDALLEEGRDHVGHLHTGTEQCQYYRLTILFAILLAFCSSLSHSSLASCVFECQCYTHGPRDSPNGP